MWTRWDFYNSSCHPHWNNDMCCWFLNLLHIYGDNNGYPVNFGWSWDLTYSEGELTFAFVPLDDTLYSWFPEGILGFHGTEMQV